jgi:hypothetical protein
MPVAVFDQGNPFIGEYPAQLALDGINTPVGQRMAFTLRVGNGTLTAVIAKDDAEKWRDQVSAMIGRMNGLIIPPGS